MSVVGSVKEFVLKVVGDYLVINVPEWAEIGKLIEFKMYDQSCGKERWFRERIVSYGNDGFFIRIMIVQFIIIVFLIWEL